MNEYNIKYWKSKYTAILWTFPPIIILIIVIYIFIKNDFIIKLFENNPVIMFGLFILTFSILFFLSLNYGLKYSSKIIRIITYDENININNGENIIYYNKIKKINLETLIAIKYVRGTITGYILNIIYENKKKLRIVVFTGTSNEEKENSELLLKFHNEIISKIKYN
jgi:hypothetical protein